MSSPRSADFALWGGRAVVSTSGAEALEAALAAVHRVLGAFDSACSSFRDDSGLARVNASGGRPVAADPVLLDTVEAALRAARLTEGAVDPTVGDALVAYGFTPAENHSRPRIEAVPGWRTVRVDRAAGTIEIARGVRLDLGATAKALAADRAAEAAATATGQGVIVSLGGDLAIAGPAPEEGWPVRVTDDHRSGIDAPGQWISLHTGGLATSSTTVRVRAGDESVHHVIDPATGRPAPIHFRTVSVAAASCLDANIATTAAIVRGAPVTGWLEAERLPSRLVLAGGEVLHLAGWPSGSEDLGTRPLAETSA
jgi:thiamine biosynthesis lipoprotein